MNAQNFLKLPLLLLMIFVSACGSFSAPVASGQQPAAVEAAPSQPAPAGVMAEKAEEQAAMPQNEAVAEEAVTDKATAEIMPEQEEAMAKAEEPAMAEAETMAKQETPAEAMPAPTEAVVDLPAWFQAELTNVNTGETFKLADFQGKVVLVETMAVWCPLCLRQQNHVKALHELVGARDDLVSVALDIDSNESEEILKAHTDKNGFDWIYAVAPPEVAREIGQLYGAQFLNPPSTPMLIIDRQGQVHPLPFGHKESTTLQESLAPFLDEG